MAGNVAEWCLDGFERHFYNRFRARSYGEEAWTVNPFNGSKKCTHHTIRGGSWADDEFDIMVTHRRAYKGRSEQVGFRCALWYNPKSVARKEER
jgi:formylglycine-generating enzyme required for sulfatase activity